MFSHSTRDLSAIRFHLLDALILTLLGFTVAGHGARPRMEVESARLRGARVTRLDGGNSIPIAQRSAVRRRCRLVPAHLVGMAVGRRPHCRADPWKYRQPFARAHRGRRDGLRHREYTSRLSPR